MFYKNYIVYHNVSHGYFVCSLKRHVYAKFYHDWLLFQRITHHLYPNCNVWPEAVYCYFTRTVYMLVSSELWVPITLPSFVCLHLLVFEIANVLPEGVYCYFTRTTLFTTMFTTILLVYLLKCMFLPSFILIDFELHAHLCPYCNVWPETVY